MKKFLVLALMVTSGVQGVDKKKKLLGVFRPKILQVLQVLQIAVTQHPRTAR